MTNQRTITTPVTKTKVVLRSWITGRQQREIDNIALEMATISLNEGKPEIQGVDATIARKIEDKSIQVVLISVGDSKNVLEAILDLPARDYQYVLNEVNNSIAGLSVEKKT